MPSDFKNPPRYVASASEWGLLHLLLRPPGTTCLCGCGRLADSLHHLINRSQGGDDVVANLIPLAGDGTTLCHGALTSANRTLDERTQRWVHPEHVRQGVRRHLAPWHLQYMTDKKGMEWVERTYPRHSW
jgi:hypothetical protein